MMKKGFPLCLLTQNGHEPLQLSQLVIFPRIPDTHSENTLRLGGAIPTEILLLMDKIPLGGFTWRNTSMYSQGIRHSSSQLMQDFLPISNMHQHEWFFLQDPTIQQPTCCFGYSSMLEMYSSTSSAPAVKLPARVLKILGFLLLMKQHLVYDPIKSLSFRAN